MKPNFFQKTQLVLVGLLLRFLNRTLGMAQRVLFKRIRDPKNILIYKIGNIGDIVCAIPSFIAVRRAYPNAHITLLTSPGKRGSLGAKELIMGVWYLDKMKVYYSDEIDSLSKKNEFLKNLREENYDLFIQLPDDLVNFRTLLRNMIFAKLVGAKAAFGFKIRTVHLFKKTQVDYFFRKTEVESLLGLLKENGISAQKVEFDFPVSEEQKLRVKDLIKSKWPQLGKNDSIVAIAPGGKREANQWPIDRFAEVAKYLNDKCKAKIIVIGGKSDIEKAKIIQSKLKERDVLITAGKINLLESLELLKHCDFLISNSTGPIHLASAAGVPCIGLYSVRDIPGRWSPYGKNNIILYNKFLDCDYKNESCIKKSIKLISVKNVTEACHKIVK